MKPIALGCFFIGLTVLGQTGYTMYRDRALAAAEESRRILIADSAAQTAKLAKARAAWAAATHDIGVQFVLHLLTAAENTHVRTSVKVYSHTDVSWRDSRSVTICGFLITFPDPIPTPIPGRDLRAYYSWSRDLVLLDDDSWGTKRPTFNHVNVSKDEGDSMFTVEIKP